MILRHLRITRYGDICPNARLVSHPKASRFQGSGTDGSGAFRAPSPGIFAGGSYGNRAAAETR